MAVCLVIAAFFLGSQSAILVQNSHIDTKGTPDTDSAHNTELTGTPDRPAHLPVIYRS